MVCDSSPIWGAVPCGYLSAHRLVRRPEWRLLRAQVLREAEGRCQACGEAQERFMVCHERWDYDDEADVATLGTLAILCHECNRATHARHGGTHRPR